MKDTFSGFSPKPVQRIIDASLNRAGEGLRVLEEICRMVLDDAGLTSALKTMRHDMELVPLDFKYFLLESRDAPGDVGAFLTPATLEPERDLGVTVTANARRVEQALRVLEELSKLPEVPLESGKYQSARFALYDVERHISELLAKHDLGARIQGLCPVIDPEYPNQAVGLARQFLEAGVTALLVSGSSLTASRQTALLGKIKQLCLQHGALLLVEGRFDVALACRADGFVANTGDLPPDEINRIAPFRFITGIKITSPAQAEASVPSGTGFVWVDLAKTGSESAPFFSQADVIRKLKRSTHLPVVAFRGTTHDNISAVIHAGVDCVALAFDGNLCPDPAVLIEAFSNPDNPEAN